MQYLRVALVWLCIVIGLVHMPAAEVLASANDFRITSYGIDYFLSKDSEQRSFLKTTEYITAQFPDYDQNHGIERAIPKSYDGHSTRLAIESVTNSAQQPLNFTTYTANDNLVVRIGDADTYVHGSQSYVITYTQHDVTRYFESTSADEFYWDTNGTDWTVPIDALSVKIHLDEVLRQAHNNQISCYKGGFGSNERCEVTPTEDGYLLKAQNLLAGQNATLAIGFAAQTFASYQQSTADKLRELWLKALVVTAPIAALIIILTLVQASRWSGRRAEVHAVPPEYIPPKDVSVATASVIYGKFSKVFAAQLVDLAVRHYLKIFQTREKSLFKPANYELEIIKDISTLKAEEQELLKDIFDNPVVGARLDMSSLRRNYTVTARLSDNQKKLTKNITGSYQLRARDPQRSAWFKRTAGVTFLAALLTLSPWLAIASIISLSTSYTLKPLTDLGLELYHYLKGLEMYIKAAETDRLAMLQSPQGAAKEQAPIDTNNTRALVKLYERVLPYAIIFGQEKQWNKQLGEYYQTTAASPSWYHGMQPFNPVAFSSAMNQFNSSATYSNPTSASTGGSSGGGFSGGGGGGGGGGGW